VAHGQKAAPAFEAAPIVSSVQQDLGLKLELREQRTIHVLAIDTANKASTEN